MKLHGAEIGFVEAYIVEGKGGQASGCEDYRAFCHQKTSFWSKLPQGLGKGFKGLATLDTYHNHSTQKFLNSVINVSP